MELSISAHSKVNAQGVYKNGQLIYQNEQQEPFAVYAKEAYRSLNPGYAKFFKMDELCKLAFLASEVLLSDQNMESREEGADIALILGNRNSSLASDLAHHQAYYDRNNYFPSPAVFVYTLPNVMLGEICIRHQITGENSCFMMQEPDAELLYRYVRDLFEKEDYQFCITGWVDYHPDHYEAQLFLVEKATTDSPLIRKFDPYFIYTGSV